MKNSYDNEALSMFLLELANYQDNLLQTYRNIFIASQTFIISIATLTTSFNNSNSNLTFIFQLIIGISILIYWRKITYSRGLDVSYCHMQLEKSEKKTKLTNDEMTKPFYSFKNWQKKSKKEKEKELRNYDNADKKDKRKIFESYTRGVMGTKLPFIYSIVWVLLSLIYLRNFI
ncbi:MAG: hypothetical protein IMZ60_01335 [Actinobacteria bacterium]|nr:hypothetical protein [Actinomycetota bacterium]